VKAIRVHAPGGGDAMRLEDLPDPVPGPGEALVLVEAAGVNFIDVYQRSGFYQLPAPFTLGQEGAGVVTQVGAGVSDVKPGDRVAWAAPQGSYADHAIVPAARLVPVPDDVTTRQAAAAMLQGMTAHYLALSTYPLKPGDTCLVHAAAGGAGGLLVQIAKLRGARVIATVGSEAKAAVAKAHGADDVILYRQADVAAEVKRLTSGRLCDVVYDGVGKDTFAASVASTMPRGTLVSFGQSSGAVGPVDPLVVLKGSKYLTRPTLQDYVMTREELLARAKQVLGWIGAGKVKLTIYREYPLKDAAAAHRDLESRATVGKLLLVPESADM
jgi:NADPH2:quinone reductase